MSATRKVWYVLVIKGGTRDPNARASARLRDDDDIDDLRVQVKDACPNALAEVDAGDLVVYANQAAFAGDLEQQQSLPASHRLHGLGLNEDDHIVVTIARPRGFRWREPRSLVHTTAGAAWDFQDTAVDKRVIAQDLKVHFAAWRQESPSKHCQSVFVCCDGPGTGKSRLLDEFPTIVKASLFADDTGADDHEDDRAMLRELSQNVYTFKVACDEVTPVNPVFAGRPDIMIGTRMLYQLRESIPWDAFLANPRNRVTLVQR